MPAALIPLGVGQWPGVHYNEQDDGYLISQLGDHSAVYMVVTGATGPIAAPTSVASLEDFTNQFGTSPSAIHVDAYFENDELGALFVVRAATLGIADLRAAIESLRDATLRQGFLLCPEGFATLATAELRTQLATAMIDHCQRESVQWVALLDASRTATSSVTTLTAERNQRNSERGHGAYYAPWVQYKGEWIAPSAVVAGIATRRSRREGFGSAPAGLRYLPRGVTAIERNYTDAQQGQLNAAGINCFRLFPTGIALWGARTTSVSSYFKFIHQRAIFNVIAIKLSTTLKLLTFDLVDGQGLLFRRVRTTVAALLQRYYEAGVLFGATPKDAFLVICDRSNNPSLDLENAVIRVDAYATPSPVAERIAVRAVRIPIGYFEVNI